MKVSTTNDNGGNAFTKNIMAPILFYPKADGSLGSDDEKSTECDHNVMVHEVCYDPANADSQMYKIYLNPFDTGFVEQWLKFLMKLNLIITRNGLMAGLAKFNLMWSQLKGEALQQFINKAHKLKTETNVDHKMCINVVFEHISPKNALQMQKCYLQKVHLHGSMTISKYFARWHQINNYLMLFPPHSRVAQKLKGDKITELIYNWLPNCMQSNLKRLNEFDINNTDLMKFCKVLEHLKLSYQLEKKSGKSKKLEMSKKDVDKPSGKHSGKKHANTTNKLLPVSAKKPCLLHGTCSHTTDECKVMKEQAQQIKEMYEAQALAEHSKKCKEMKAKKAPTHNKINEMVAENVKKSVKQNFMSKLSKSAAARILIAIVTRKMSIITWNMLV